MTKWIIGAVVGGILAGYFFVPEALAAHCGTFITVGLCLILFLVGVDMGRQGNVWRDIRAAGFKVLLIPVAVAVGTIGFAAVSSLFLPLTAQEAIQAYYDSLGLLYRTYDELENAYAAYLESGRDPSFDSYLVGQETSPCASSDRVIYFLTSVTLPINGSVATEVRLGAAFDRETGEHLSPWDLFACSEEEARQTLLDLAQPSDGTDGLRAEMEAALTPESLIFFPDHLELSFPEGTLPSQSHAFLASVDYETDLGDILQDWAIPREQA